MAPEPTLSPFAVHAALTTGTATAPAGPSGLFYGMRLTMDVLRMRLTLDVLRMRLTLREPDWKHSVKLGLSIPGNRRTLSKSLPSHLTGVSEMGSLTVHSI